MPDSDLVRVRWTGPFEGELPEGGGSFAPGAVIEVTAAQAAESAWFVPVADSAPKAAAPPPARETEG
jgi:hypothetical protein